jgi:tRNA(Ile)-lysidine synthase
MALGQKVAKTIAKYGMLARGDGVLVAVSGGPDSVALLHVLSNLKSDLALRLEVAHIEHGIRGAGSRDDARFVAALADRLSIPFHIKELGLRAVAAAHRKGNLEALAREGRYRFLTDTARERGLGKIATGHTLDDQAETVLMRLFRGSGRSGLGAMAPVSRRGAALLIRPLIESSREEIEAYLAEAGLEYRTDPTNFDPALLRNWLRLEMMPRLKEKIDPAVAVRLARLADIARGEDEELNRLARERMAGMIEGDIVLRGALLAEPEAMRRRIVRLWIEQARGGLKSIGFDHIEAILDLIATGPPQGRVAIPGGLDVVRRYEELAIERRSRRHAVTYSYTIDSGGSLYVPEAGLTIATAVKPTVRLPETLFEAIFDMAALPEKLTIRNFRPGDRFQPLGLAGHKKIKDLFIDRKVPMEVRRTLPLLVAGDEILWIPGYGRSRMAGVTPRTRTVLAAAATPTKSAPRLKNFRSCAAR